MKNTATANETLITPARAAELTTLACDPYQPRWIRDLGGDFDRMVKSVENMKLTGSCADAISMSQEFVDSIARQIVDATQVSK